MMRIALFLSILYMPMLLNAQNNFWHDTNVAAYNPALPQSTRYLQLDLQRAANYLANAPKENDPTTTFTLELPMPDGSFETVRVFDSPMMEAPLAARYPMIRTYKILGIKDLHLQGRMNITTQGFQTLFFSAKGETLIEPVGNGDVVNYVSYYKKDLPETEQLKVKCGVENSVIHPENTPKVETRSGAAILHKYRAAVACTGEYGERMGGTREKVLSAIVATMSKVNAIYERDLTTRLILVAKQDSLIFLNGNTDPFNDGSAAGLTSEGLTVMNQVIGINSYDIGHTFGTNCTGGIAGIVTGTGTCSATKARGASCLYFGRDNSHYQTVAHEIGHQFSANHTMSNCPGVPQAQVASSNKVEPGAGNTLMSYAGSCGIANYGGTEDYFNGQNIVEMYNFSRLGIGSGCAIRENVSNNEPEITFPYKNNFYIPVKTPLQLRANVKDADNDPLTYCWEQTDGVQNAFGVFDALGPQFRSFFPSASPERILPSLTKILLSKPDKTEILPDSTRDFSFRLTVRDNHVPNSTSAWADWKFKATIKAGPFEVVSPNVAEDKWVINKYTEVKWKVANTDKTPVNCQKVNILLSTDGGYTYPITLASGVPNDGSEVILVPNNTTTSARVKIEAADNIFFDLSNAGFSIEAATMPSFSFLATTDKNVLCAPNKSAIDLKTTALSGYTGKVNFSVVGTLPANITASFPKNDVTASEATTLILDYTNVTKKDSFSLTVRAVSGGETIDRVLNLRTVRSNFVGFAPSAPVTGASGISKLPNFYWTTAPDAYTYDIEIATSPAFGATIVDKKSDIVGGNYQPSVQLQDNALYFWRVRAMNECTTGAFSQIMAFHTASLTCLSYDSKNASIISASGTPIVNNLIQVAETGIVSDVNVLQVKGTYNALPNLDVTVIAPSGKEVTLFSGVCFSNTTLFNAGFDDDAPNKLDCDKNNIYGNTPTTLKPLKSLSDFVGEKTEGAWKLRLKVLKPDGGGTLELWKLQLCSSLALNPPKLVKNDSLPVRTGGGQYVSNNFLNTTDPNNSAEQLTFTLVNVPQYGTLYLNGTPLKTGDNFKQSDINNSLVLYRHNNSNTKTDNFTFVVRDGEGGWIGVPQFNFKIGATFVSGLADGDASKLLLYPNPVTDIISVELLEPVAGKLEASILNLQGQILYNQQVTNKDKFFMDAKGLPEGIYFVRLVSEKSQYVKKIVVQK
jgi:Metallo-peptidase family M12B Reprolysin-like/Cadherin-like/Secretion system C-terminal sorting domain/Proprotein convertase P-domain